jgi:hypothetical protein
MIADHMPFMDPKVLYRVHKSLPLAPILRQFNPLHTLTLYSFNVHFNFIPNLRLSLPSSFSVNILYEFLIVYTRTF